jgi:hypothetical protein
MAKKLSPFEQAYANARAEGLLKFDFNGQQYHTRRADETDGLVHLASQRYPAVPGAFAPQRLIVPRDAADSHAGAMKSPGVLSSTFEAIGRIEGRTP